MTSVIEQKTQRQVRFLRLPEVLARTGLTSVVVPSWVRRFSIILVSPIASQR